MLTVRVLILWVAVAGLSFVIYSLIVKRFFSADARERRRRRRNYARAISRKRGAVVKLAVKVPRS